MIDWETHEDMERASQSHKILKKEKRPVVLRDPSVEVRRYFQANWFTQSGVAKKMKLYISKGIPDLRNWRFITITLDPKMFEDEVDGYLTAKKHLRRFMLKMKKYLGLKYDPAWCRKMEFQRNGWVHWHMIYQYTDKLSMQEMSDIEELWGLGALNFQRCNDKSIHYLFKYAFKQVFDCPIGHEDEPEQEDQVIMLPDWFLDYYVDAELKARSKPDSPKKNPPRSFARVRFWQTENFYTGEQPKSENEKANSCIIPRSMREHATESFNKVQLLARRAKDNGYRKSTVVVASVSAAALFSQLSVLVLKGEAAPNYNQSYIVNTKNIKNLFKNNNLTKLCQIQQLNQISPKAHLATQLRLMQMS